MISKVQKRIKSLLPPTVAAIVLIIGFMFFKYKNGLLKVAVTKAEIRSISKTISTSGQTGVTQGFTARALIAGSIKKVNFTSGDDVRKDDIVLEFDQASLKASMNTAYSTYLGAKADSESYGQRISAAKATESIRKRERDEAWREYMGDNKETNKQNYKNAEALYQTALASLKTLQNDEKTVQNTVASSYSSYYSAFNNYVNGTVKASTDGRLALGDISQGSYVVAGQELFSIISPTNIVFKAEIDETDVNYVQIGMRAQVSLDSYPGKIFDATIQTIDAKVILLPNGSTAIMADIVFDTSNVLPVTGLGGSADIEIEKLENTLAITPDAIIEEAGKKYVYVTDTLTVQKREVETGFDGDEYIGITAGLNEGEMAVIDPGSLKLQDGQKIKL